MPEPTIADVITVMQAGFAQVSTELARTNAKVDRVQTEMREGFAGLKSEIAIVERCVLDARRTIVAHCEDPNAHRDAA